MIYVNGVINVVKRNGVRSGVLILLRYHLESSILVVIVALPVIRPHPILTLCQGAIGKYIRYVAPLIIKPHDCNVPANIACDAHIIIMTLSFTICLSLMPPSKLEGYNLCFNLFFDRSLKAMSHCRLPAL